MELVIELDVALVFTTTVKYVLLVIVTCIPSRSVYGRSGIVGRMRTRTARLQTTGLVVTFVVMLSQASAVAVFTRSQRSCCTISPEELRFDAGLKIAHWGGRREQSQDTWVFKCSGSND